MVVVVVVVFVLVVVVVVRGEVRVGRFADTTNIQYMCGV